MQNTLLEQGTDLMLYGMGSVFVFLTLLVISTGLMSSVIRRFFPELPEVDLPAGTSTQQRTAVDPKHLAAIKAAIELHRKG